MRRIELGGPHAIEGANNAYVFSDAGVVVDPGPPTTESWEALLSGIDAAGVAVDEIDRVLLTHWHGDHSGLAPRLADRASATIAVHRHDAPWVENYPSFRDDQRPVLAATLQDWGTPNEVVEAVLGRASIGATMDPCDVTKFEDGATVGGLTAVHTPGHTLGHTAFESPDGLLVGDTILPDYTPNVGGTDIRLDDPLGVYLDSLSRLLNRRSGTPRDRRDSTVYPGHGSPLDLDARVHEIVAHHEGRCRKIRSTIEERGPSTPWQIATELFGDLSGIHIRLGVGEAAAHLEYLRRDGVLTLHSEHPLRFESRDSSLPIRIDISPE